MSSPKISFDQSGPYIENFAGQRYTYTTKKAYEDVISSLRSSVASPQIVLDYLKEAQAGSFSGEQFAAAVDKAVNSAEKPSGLFLFVEFNHGQWYKSFHPQSPRFHKFVIGNPLFLKNMVDHDNVASLNAPWNFLVLEVLDANGRYLGTKVVFDLPSGTMESEAGGKELIVQSKILDEKFKRAVLSWL